MKYETNLQDGIKKVTETRRPGMVIIHKSTCGACKNLKAILSGSKEIDRLSSYFIVISLVDDDEPRETKWTPDGRYVPRIFFLDTSGQIMKEVINAEGNPRYRYFYANEKCLLLSMQKVLHSIPGSTSEPVNAREVKRK